jgi:hypothetical protein
MRTKADIELVSDSDAIRCCNIPNVNAALGTSAAARDVLARPR